MPQYLAIVTTNYIDSIDKLREFYKYDDSQELKDLFSKIQKAGMEKDFFELLEDEEEDHWKDDELRMFLEQNKIQILNELGLLTVEDPFYDLLTAKDAFFQDDSPEVIYEGDWTLDYNDKDQNTYVYYKDKLILKVSYPQHTIEYINQTELPLYQVASVLDADTFRRI